MNEIETVAFIPIFICSVILSGNIRSVHRLKILRARLFTAPLFFIGKNVSFETDYIKIERTITMTLIL